jgi:preprotein translocase subunit SecB
MADTANGMNNESAADSVSLGIAQQYIKDLSFESPESPHVFLEQTAQPNVNVNFNVAAENIREDIHEVVLNINIQSEIDGKTIFIAELAYAGLCQVKGASPEFTQQALMIEVPRQLFPFARAILADAIRNGGFPPLLLNPIDFQQFYRDHSESAPEGDA